MSLAFDAEATPRSGWGYAAAGGLVALAAAGGVLLDQATHVPNLSLIFVLPVVIAAARFGWGPALAAAVGGALACNYFFLAPRYSLRVADPANVWALRFLLAVAAVVSAVAAEARRRAIEAAAAADQASAVHILARRLMAEHTRDGVARACADALARVFRTPACVVLPGRDGEGLEPVVSGGGAFSDADSEAAAWALASNLAVRGGAYPAGEAAFDFWPLRTALRGQAAVGVALAARPGGRPAEPLTLVETVVGHLATALDREAYAEQALAAAREGLKAELLAAVSHDLRTPLATILFTLQSLQRFDDAHDPSTRRDLLAGAEAEAARLAAMVESLLDMNRVEGGALAVRPEPVDAAFAATSAIQRSAAALAGREVRNDADAHLSLSIDPALFDAALGNVLENAGRYAPAGSLVEVRSGSAHGVGWIEVLDRGPGLGAEPERLFEKFARGAAGDGRPPGVGLGLSLARAFLRAMGGDVAAADREGGGAVVRLSAPLAAS